MKKIHKQTANYIELALKFYTLEHQKQIKRMQGEGKNVVFTKEFFDYKLADSLRELEQVTRKK